MYDVYKPLHISVEASSTFSSKEKVVEHFALMLTHLSSLFHGFPFTDREAWSCTSSGHAVSGSAALGSSVLGFSEDGSPAEVLFLDLVFSLGLHNIDS